ncbi:transmembrane protein 151B-like [Homarus americanus]|uniref:Transmembrane protein 151B-like n=1 Tax=Homarus americanus TaxID=6706 RepID=A0A8J5J9B5_HOMAM|nr:transmembrane protein 151B-like [Homarus americanus]KAG7153288.1 Transmembrane protein 151B-like [Homarus americanus]
MSLTPLDEDGSEEQRPVRQTVCETLRHGANWKCFILTLLIVSCLAAITWCRLTQVTKVIVNFDTFPITRTRHLSPCEDGYLYIPIAFLAMLYLVYLVECFHCPTRIQLTHTTPASHVSTMIESMRSAQPVIWWKAMCYHYVRRSRHITRYRNGDAYTSTQVFYERVNSHAAGTCFLFSNCGVKDISKKLVNLSKYSCTKIRFSKGFAFANLETANEFEEQRARFFQENERRDDYMELREGLDLTNVNFKEFVIARRDTKRPPWYSRHAVFWAASLLLLSWPLRLVIEYNTSYVHYQVTKLFGVNYTTPVSGGRASRGSATTDSHDLELTIANNCTLIPSYSEALLMEAGATPTSILTPSVDANGNIQNGGGSLPAAASSASVGSELLPGSSTGPAASRTSLHNGYILYHPSPLMPCFPTDPFQGRRRTTPTENPPTYDDALRVSAPLLGTMSPSPMRRSHTERDIPSTPRLALPRHSCHYDLETQL